VTTQLEVARLRAAVSVPTWIRLDSGFAALAATAARTTIVATQLVLLPCLDGFMTFMIAA
jgi:hypothetical protein